MKITYTRDRLPDERVIQTVPGLALRVGEDWYRRPHIYKGRALTDKTLILNAQHHVRHLQLFGQHLSPGVVQGLQISQYQKKVVADNGADQLETWLAITPGMALTHKGDDIALSNLTHVALEEVYTVATVTNTDIEDESTLQRLIFNRFLKVDPRDTTRSYLTLYSRDRTKVAAVLEKIGVTKPAPILDAWDQTQVRPKGPGILVLEPVEIIDEVAENSTSQCPWDPEQDPFSDERLIDGCRLIFYPWPAAELGSLPRHNDPHYRSKLVYRIFDYELAQYQKRGRPRNVPIPVSDSDVQHPHKDYKPYIPLPWENYGVALALTDVAINGTVNFLDAYAVVRKGGAPLSTKPIIEINGSPFLWEARIQQFVAHIYDLAEDPQTLPAAIQHFDSLPPVGLLPKQLLDFDTMRTNFFPSQYLVEAAPIPEEQLEVAMNASASLEPFDVYRPERVKLLVPVPQEVFEPALLKKEQPDPIFLNTIRQLVYEIRALLYKRNIFRSMAPKVVGAIDWHDIPVYAADAGATPDESKFPIVFVPRIPLLRTFETFAENAIVNLANWIIANTNIDADADVQLMKNRQKIGTSEFPGLEQIIVNFQRKIFQTELYLSTGYLRAEADIYRMRQMMLGAEKATRLATSPAIGQIVEGYTRIPSVDELQTYFSKAIEKVPEEPEPVLAAAAIPGAARVAPDVIASRWTEYKKPIAIEAITGLARGKKIVERVYEAPAAETKQNTVQTKSMVFDVLAKVPLEFPDDDDKVAVTSSDRSVMTRAEYDTMLAGLGTADSTKVNVMKQRAKVSTDYVTILTIPLTDDEKTGLEEEDVAQLEGVIGNRRGKNVISLNAKDEKIAAAIRDGIFDPDPKDGDEANYFSVGVEVLEHALEAMRKVDRRLDDYRKALTQCQRVLKELYSNSAQWREALMECDNQLSVRRHDVLVARSLYEEERARVEAINQHRLQILEQYVTSLAYVRPRLVEARRDAPSVKLYAEYVNPVPACLAEDYDATDELRDMLDVFREVPVSWFVKARPLVTLLDHPVAMMEVFTHAVQRSQQRVASPPPESAYKVYNPSIYGETVNQLVYAHRTVTQQYHDNKVKLNLEQLKQFTWKDLAIRAENDLSLADLIEAGKGRSTLAKQATAVMEAIEDVAVCFYARCNDITPAIRLQWANNISIFDQPVALQNLEVLPAWDQLDIVFRRDLQNMVDWLFTQVNPGQKDAHNLMNDLVRVCILLASHAPVSTIIRGYAPNPVQGKVGDLVDIVIDKGLVKVGMVATFFSEDAVVAQGVVDNISAGAATIKVTETRDTSGQFYVEKNTSVKVRSAGTSKASASKKEIIR